MKVTGAPREALVGTDFSDYFTEPDKARAGYQQVFAQGSVTDYPLTIRHRDGRLTDVLYNASVYTDAAGHVLGVFAAARDVTAQKAAEAESRGSGNRSWSSCERAHSGSCSTRRRSRRRERHRTQAGRGNACPQPEGARTPPRSWPARTPTRAVRLRRVPRPCRTAAGHLRAGLAAGPPVWRAARRKGG